jgi:hypothetical protein
MLSLNFQEQYILDFKCNFWDEKGWNMVISTNYTFVRCQIILQSDSSVFSLSRSNIIGLDFSIFKRVVCVSKYKLKIQEIEYPLLVFDLFKLM